MIKQYQRFFNLILIFIDLAVITLSLFLAWYIRFETNLLGFGRSEWGLYHYMMPLILIIPMYILLYYNFHLYDPQRTSRDIGSEAFEIIKANIVGVLVLVAVLFVLDLTDYSRFLLAMFAIFSTTFSILERYLLRRTLQYFRSKDYNIKYILVIGAGELAEKFSRKVADNNYLGYRIIGFLDDKKDLGYEILHSQVIGRIEELEQVIMTKEVDQVIVTLPLRHYDLFEQIVDTCEKHGIKAEIIPDYYRYFPAKPYIDLIDDMPLIKIRYVHLDNSFRNAMKRILDIIFALVALIILSPLLVVVAILVKVNSPGPIIFQQERVGLNRKNFQMYKFRSMKVQDEEVEKSQWTTKDDPRKTRFGSFIRRTSIDELPQLVNILKGEMSLIGPRPERPLFVENFRDQIPKYMIKHHVRPGMTGWAQVNGYRGNTSIKKRIEYDIYYVENWTIGLDIRIFFRSLFHLLDENAY